MLQYPMDVKPSEIVLTDVSVRVQFPISDELLFARMSKFTIKELDRRWRVVIEHKAGKGLLHQPIDFGDNKSECDRFYNQLSATFKEWQNRFSDVARDNDDNRASN